MMSEGFSKGFSVDEAIEDLIKGMTPARRLRKPVSLCSVGRQKLLTLSDKLNF